MRYETSSVGSTAGRHSLREVELSSHAEGFSQPVFRNLSLLLELRISRENIKSNDFSGVGSLLLPEFQYVND